MGGLGLVLAFFGYCVLYWGIEGIQGNKQPRFLGYVWPFGGLSQQSGQAGSPKSTSKPTPPKKQ